MRNSVYKKKMKKRRNRSFKLQNKAQQFSKRIGVNSTTPETKSFGKFIKKPKLRSRTSKQRQKFINRNHDSYN